MKITAVEQMIEQSRPDNPSTTREWTFGYDVDNVQRVQDYVKRNYSSDDYNMEFGYGEDVMNALTMLNWVTPDWDLKELIWECDGEGHFEE